VTRLNQAFELATETGSTPDAAQALCSLAEVELSTADYAPAEEHARHALALLDGRPDFLDVAGAAQLRLGKALLEQERLDEAEATFHDAEVTLAQLSSASHVAAAWSAQGELALKRGDSAQAALLYRRATEALQDYCF
jgi:tetratricopeptide (TPR) repeat protein